MEYPLSHGNSAGNRASVPNVRLRRWTGAEPPAGNVATLESARANLPRARYRVLLAHDLTGPSEVALVRAARLALEREGHLTILHVVDSEQPAAAIEAQRSHARSQLETEVRRWLGRYKLPYRIDIGIGDPAGAIAARARAHDVDLVVTGRQQRSGCAHRFENSTVGRLLRQVRQPVLVVGNPDQSPYRRVLIPVDLTEASAAGIRFAATFLAHARLHLLHTYKRRLQDYVASASSRISREGETGKCAGMVRQESEQALCGFLATVGLGERSPIITIENGDLLVRLKEELARQKTDLLVLGTHARSRIEHAQIGSAAETAVRSSPCDALFLRIT